jgi:hypothetical protein
LREAAIQKFEARWTRAYTEAGSHMQAHNGGKMAIQ